jgi:hypothetical protein
MHTSTGPSPQGACIVHRHRHSIPFATVIVAQDSKRSNEVVLQFEGPCMRLTLVSASRIHTHANHTCLSLTFSYFASSLMSLRQKCRETRQKDEIRVRRGRGSMTRKENRAAHTDRLSRAIEHEWPIITATHPKNHPRSPFTAHAF